MASTHGRFPDIGKVFLSLCKRVDSPVSLGAWLRFAAGEHLQLAEMELDPDDYSCPKAFGLDYLIVSFLSKWKGLVTGRDLEQTALRKFHDSEEKCKDTNERIIRGRFQGHPPDVERAFTRARKKILSVLGDLSSVDVLKNGGFGPGATDDIRRRRAFPDTKMLELPISVTPRAAGLFLAALETDLHWSAALLQVSPEDLMGPFRFLKDTVELSSSCVIKCVPKNAKTHRIIAVEPRANAYIQKAYGSHIRSRLKRVHVTLDDQGRNQRAARAALRRGLATLDLKAASDTVATELVYELLPLDWANALDTARSHVAVLPDGKQKKLCKFSSMGNGFTFELESLIFWALAGSVDEFCCEEEGDFCVYGDDIIVPSRHYDAVVDLLVYSGFEVNASKSFKSGLFYESCGEHYFGGVNVTPIYQKETIEDHLDDETQELVEAEDEAIRLGNRLLRYALSKGSEYQLLGELRNAWQYVFRENNSSQFLQLPLGTEGDDGWLVPASYFLWHRSWNRNHGFGCNVIRREPVSLPAADSALLAMTLRHHGPSRLVEPIDQSLGRTGTALSWEGQIADRNVCVVKRPAKIPWRTSVRQRWVIPTWEFGLDW